MFHSYFERKNGKVLTFNIVISLTLKKAPSYNWHRPQISAAPNSLKKLIRAGGAY